MINRSKFLRMSIALMFAGSLFAPAVHAAFPVPSNFRVQQAKVKSLTLTWDDLSGGKLYSNDLLAKVKKYVAEAPK